MAYDDQGVGPNDIAIVGMALRVPGASSVDQFWQNLRDGRESIRDVGSDELVAAGESAERIRRRSYVARTAELPGMELFDAEFFGFSPKEAAIMDPQHRHFLECAWEALEDASRPPEGMSGPVGMFAGCGMGSYFYFNVCSHRNLVDQVGMFLLRHTGNDKDFLATRASYAFDLRGPSINVQTACSTSLVAVHLACQSLLSGECDMALAGGVTIELPHRRGYLYQDGEILSPDGHCRAFDHRAAGTVFGSGVGVVVLRRLSDAIADNDPIRAVIKGTAINNDGASKAGYLAPSVSGQSAAVVEALGLAGVGAESVGYVECHGTGTYLGDPIEIAALTQAYRQSTSKAGFCRVGSVKSNIGHLDTAAGVVSLMKAVLALENEAIPPTLGFEKPNPAIDFANSPFVVNDRLMPWPRTEKPRRAGVNSLGVGGTNAHVVIEEAPRRAPRTVPAELGPQLLLITAKSRKALDAAGRDLARHLDANPGLRLDDVAYTLLNGRRRFEHRRVVGVADRADAVAVLTDAQSRRVQTHTPIETTPTAVFLFPGGGTQYLGMAKSLYQSEPGFAAFVDEGLSYLATGVAAEIRDLWFGAHAADSIAAERFLRPALQLPAIVILEVALARHWMDRGVVPAALLGHSMGEYAAACIAGVMSYRDVVNLVYLRGQLFEEIRGGGMLSVPLALDELMKRLPAELDVAAINAPELCVVSGTNEALDAFREALVADGVDASRVAIDIAAHSRALEPILTRFEAFLRSVRLNAPAIPIVSNLTGTWLTAEEARDPLYWVSHLRSTVRFADGLATLAADKGRVYIEAGPGRVLSSLAKMQGRIDANQVINSLPHGQEVVDDRLHFLTALGRALVVGLAVTTDHLWTAGEPRRVTLPSYPFQRERYFLDNIGSAAVSAGAAEPVKRPDLATWGWAPIWRPAYAPTKIGADRAPRSFLLFVDGNPFGQRLVARLRKHGHRVTTVEVGDAFGQSGEGNYVLCPEHGREGYDRLVADLVNTGGVPSCIVNLWLHTASEDFRPGSSFFHQNQERGFYSLFFLAQALADVELTSPLQIVAVTNGMQRVGDEALPYPEKATILGPAQVIPHEFPGVFVRAVDLSAPSAAASRGPAASAEWAGRLGELAGIRRVSSEDDQLWEELFAETGNDIAAYRDGRRWVRDYHEVPLEPVGDAAARFRENGVYIVTGGLGGVAVACCEEMARRHRAKLVLIGRTELPERSRWRDYLAAHGDSDRLGKAIVDITRIEAAGGEVAYVVADVTNPDDIRNVLATAKSRFGAVHGVLHAAGVVKDDLIAIKSTSDIEDVFAPKVLGTVVLDEVLAGEGLDLVVLFSSTSTDTAPAGQVDYVAANAYLNAVADSRRHLTSPRTVAVHWGVWNEVGLAARAVRAPEQDGTTATVAPASQPLFDRRVHDGAKGDWLELRCDPARHWLLGEHRLASGEAIWPGTGYLELVAEAAREIGMAGALEIEDLTFLRPLHVPEGETRTVRVLYRRDGGRFRIAVESKVELSGGTGWLKHAEALVMALGRRSATPLPIEELVRSSRRTEAAADGASLATAQHRHLRFGPRWGVLRGLHFGTDYAVAALRLDEAFTGDLQRGLLLHPALVDIATGCAMGLIDGYDAAAGLWVPMNYGRVRMLRPIAGEIWSHIRLAADADLGPGFATFDVTIADRDGRVLVEIERFVVRQLPADSDFKSALRDVSDARIDEQKSASSQELSPALARLASQVAQGIEPGEGFEALVRAIGTGLPQVVVSSLDLRQLQQAVTAAEVVSTSSTAFERPNLDSEFVAPRNDIEKTLAGFWSELLGVQAIGVNDSFFDLGGHSLIAVRLFRMIKKEFATDFPISVLFEAPTIAQCAQLIESAGGRRAQSADKENTAAASGAAKPPARAYAHLVQMHPGKDIARTPFFLCAGMFGNILNLRHLAVQVGIDRPVYGLQAQGLYGDRAPHETFEEMASANIAELRSVQAHGPYLLGGFSGGGLVAYEMAQQLTRDGEAVAGIVMLDTPYPEEVTLTVADRLAMKAQDLQREGLGFVGRWVKRRIAWERERLRRGRAGEQLAGEYFHNAEIEAAFRRALDRYEGRPYGGAVVNYRPKHQAMYRISNGRLLNAERSILRSDNGWSSMIADLTMVEVPGDHDSMVLEPNVRVLASYVRAKLREFEASAHMALMAAE